MKKFYFILPLLLIYNSSLSQVKNSSKNQSKFAIERQYNKLMADLEETEDELELYESFYPLTVKTKSKIDKITFKEKQILNKINLLKKTYSGLKTELESGSINYTSIEKLKNIYIDIKSLITKELENTVLYYREIEYGINQNSKVENYIKSLVLEDLFDNEPDNDFMPKLSYYSSFRYRDKTIDLSNEIINEIKNNIETYDLKNAEILFDQIKSYRSSINDFVSKKINEKIVTLTKKRDNIELQLIDMDKSLEDRQQVVDSKLINAVYFMIAALIILFSGLYFFKMEVSQMIIQKRSLVEVISMAFMLITIIILGTGGKIGNETLGTLLGTIAGYIFGRSGMKNES